MPKPIKSTPVIPHVSVKNEPPEPEAEEAPIDAAAVAKKKRLVITVAGIAAVLVLGGVAFTAYKMFLSPAPPPPPAAKTKAGTASAPKAPAPKAPVAAAPAPATAAAPTAPPPAAPATPSATLNALAHAPANAINKAQGAVEARRAAGQSNVDAALTGEELANKPALAAPAAAGSKTTVPKSATAMKSVARGVSASTELEGAAIEASVEFRTFVANAKISGVFQGSPSRAFINGRMARSGDTIDAGFGIIFEGVDPVKKQVLFKDKSGAILARKY